MVAVAQLVRASDCGSEGRGFESHLPPIAKSGRKSLFGLRLFFVPILFYVCDNISFEEWVFNHVVGGVNHVANLLKFLKAAVYGACRVFSFSQKFRSSSILDFQAGYSLYVSAIALLRVTCGQACSLCQ